MKGMHICSVKCYLDYGCDLGCNWWQAVGKQTSGVRVLGVQACCSKQHVFNSGKLQMHMKVHFMKLSYVDELSQEVGLTTVNGQLTTMMSLTYYELNSSSL